MKIKKKIANPMTVIAIFAFISESSAAISLPFLEEGEREIYVWFLISFPFYLLLLFFITLNFNYRSLYAPSDFDKDESFLKVIANTPDFKNTSAPESAEKAKIAGLDFRPVPHDCETHAEHTERLCPCAEHNIQLPKELGTLRVIDVRRMHARKDFEALVENLTRGDKQSARAILFLSNAKSSAFLMQIVPALCKQARKRGRATHYIAYNPCTRTSMILKRE